MKVLVMPRDSNPYQQLLYRELNQLGVETRYVGEVTGSQTLNLVLLPLELALLRLAGWKILHIHWVFGFSLPWARRRGRLLAQLWFGAVLVICRALRIRIVWTAHNVLPHQPVFANDLLARRWLVRASALVVVHDVRALQELRRLGLAPRRSEVIPPGSFGPPAGAQTPRVPGSGPPPWMLLCFGKVLPYKGVEDLLIAVGGLPATVSLRIVVAGECLDRLRQRLLSQAAACAGRVELRFGHVPDHDVASLLQSSDAVVLPYRAVTTSSSLLLAFEHARPVIVPDLPAFADYQGAGVRRYDGTIAGLRAALTEFAALEPSALAQASAAAAAQASTATWAMAARSTFAAFLHI